MLRSLLLQLLVNKAVLVFTHRMSIVCQGALGLNTQKGPQRHLDTQINGFFNEAFTILLSKMSNTNTFGINYREEHTLEYEVSQVAKQVPEG